MFVSLSLISSTQASDLICMVCISSLAALLPDAGCHSGTPPWPSARRCSARRSVATATRPLRPCQGERLAGPCPSRTCGSRSADTEGPWSPSEGGTTAGYSDLAVGAMPPCADSILSMKSERVCLSISVKC